MLVKKYMLCKISPQDCYIGLVVTNYFLDASISVCHYVIRNIKEVYEVFSKSLQFSKGDNMHQIADSVVEWKEAHLSRVMNSSHYSDPV